MAVTIVATPGSATANSFVTLAEAVWLGAQADTHDTRRDVLRRVVALLADRALLTGVEFTWVVAEARRQRRGK
mgnify:CR=1 FL=1